MVDEFGFPIEIVLLLADDADEVPVVNPVTPNLGTAVVGVVTLVVAVTTIEVAPLAEAAVLARVDDAEVVVGVNVEDGVVTVLGVDDDDEEVTAVVEALGRVIDNCSL